MENETESQIDLDAIARAPYAKVARWMSRGLGLSDQKLTAFALIWEASHPSGADSSRIDAAYAARACDTDDTGLYLVLSELVRARLVDFSFDAGDALSAFRASESGVVSALRANEAARAKKRAQARSK